jgi:hypothetical protein
VVAAAGFFPGTFPACEVPLTRQYDRQVARELARPLPPGLADRSEFTFLAHG